MDPSAVNYNVTVDDWSGLLTYNPISAFQTPDPSAPTFAPGSWNDGTYHQTVQDGATISLDFEGPAVYVYGTAAGSFSVTLDAKQSTQNVASPNASTPQLLFSSSNLTYAKHSLVLASTGNNLLLDYILATIQLGPAKATVTNTTTEEDSPLLRYSGTWGSNTSPLFSGGGSKYTNQDHASVSFTFNGSAIEVWGDTVNDHGAYTVSLSSVASGSTAVNNTYTGLTGCGGTYGKLCEKTKPSLMYTANNLGQGEHTIVIENRTGVNQTFFDLDRFIVLAPSTYAPRNESGGTATTTSSIAASSTGSAIASHTASSTVSSTIANSWLLFGVLMLWVMRITRFQ